MRSLLKICITISKTFKSTYVSPDISLMCHPFEIQNISKMCAGAYPAVLHLCLLAMILHHTPLAKNSWTPFHELLHCLSMFLDIFFTFPTGILNQVSFPFDQIFTVCLPSGLLVDSLINDLFHLWIFSYMHMSDPLNLFLASFAPCFI